MPALAPTEYVAEIISLGVVPDTETSLRSEPRTSVHVTFDGFEGEDHSGRTRPSCVRVKSQHPKGTEIANVRQLSVVSQEELDLIAAECGLDTIDPIWLGASLVVKGIPDFTHVPPSSRLQGPDGVTLTIDMENRPCVLPGREMEKDQPGHGTRFKAAAENRRGVTAWVERPGNLQIGEQLRLHVPDQPEWSAPRKIL